MSTVNVSNIQTADAAKTIPVSRLKKGTMLGYAHFYVTGSTITTYNTWNVNSITYSNTGRIILTLPWNVVNGVCYSSPATYPLDNESAGTGYALYPSNIYWHAQFASTNSNQIYLSSIYSITNQYYSDNRCQVVFMSGTTEA